LAHRAEKAEKEAILKAHDAEKEAILEAHMAENAKLLKQIAALQREKEPKDDLFDEDFDMEPPDVKVVEANKEAKEDENPFAMIASQTEANPRMQVVNPTTGGNQFSFNLNNCSNVSFTIHKH
jgi:anti-sigma factor RsiW